MHTPHTDTSPTSPDRVIVGRVLGPWGVHGELRVEALTDDPQRFAPGSSLFLDGSAATVVSSRKHRGGIRLKLDAVNNRSQAESLLGKTLTVPSGRFRPLPEGSYYYFQIIDIEVWTEDGEHLGLVAEVLSTGANDVYVVRNGDAGEILLPAIKHVILDIDPDAKKMLVRLPEGLR
jgi:16S rRNA processing protein RimM